MTKAIRIHQHGGPEVLTWEDVDVGTPGEGEARVRHTAIGLNFLDVYQRMGGHGAPALPAVLGTEGIGVVEEIGPGVSEVKVGDRVGYAPRAGAYSQERLIAADRLVPIPKGIDDRTAAGALMKGITAEYLIRRCYQVKKGETIVAYAAAGGVGSILCQWATHLGASVIGIVGSDEKAKIARDNGCSHTINYSKEKISERVREITGGAGVPVVFDSIGGATFKDSLDCLAPRGYMVSYGNASGPVDPVPLGDLTSRGSLYLTRPTMGTYCVKREDILAGSKALFDVIEAGHVKISVGRTYPLAETAQAHRDLEARKTTGSTVLLP
ncbi:MAG: quinone oxidoreductase [Rhodospirillales bacterium]